MLINDINFRPTSLQCCEELEYIEKLIDNPDDEYSKMYLEKKNKPYKKKAASEILKKDNHKVIINEDNKSHQPQTTNKTSINPNNNFNGNDCSIFNNINFNNNNCCNNNLSNNYNNNNFNNNYNNYNFNNNFNNNNFNKIYNNINFNNNYNNNILNNNYNNINFNNIYNNNNFNNIYNNSNFNTNICSDYNFYQNSSNYASYINNQYYHLNQSKLISQNINNNIVAGFKYNNFIDMQNMMMNPNIDISNNSSLVSALQCLSACLKRYKLEKN